MLTTSHIGRTYSAEPYLIESAHVQKFAAAVAGDTDITDSISIPPTYAAVYCIFPLLALVLSDADLGIHLAGLIHGEQSLAFPIPVHIGDTVHAHGTISAVEHKRGMTFLTIALRALHLDGRIACEGETLLIIRGATK